MIKASDSTFAAAKTACTLFGWYIQETANELGWDKTLDLYSRVARRLGETLAQMLRAESKGRQLLPEDILTVEREAMKSFGVDCTMSADDAAVHITFERCPIFEGLTASGIPPAIAQQICQRGGAAEHAILHEAFPDLTPSLNVRETAQAPCEEHFVLAR